MSQTMTKAEAIDSLQRAVDPETQARLREHIAGDDYYQSLLMVYLANPFFRLTDEEASYIGEHLQPMPMRALIVARHAATRTQAPRQVVFCMPKSGSSFVQSAIQHAFQTPFVSLTSVGSPGQSSLFGMNSREQELDEWAILKAIHTTPRGFVSQHHTRYSSYLALQLRLYQLAPIVTVRNLLDCIVSFDDMMLDWRRGKSGTVWLSDAQFALPLNYPQLEPTRRYELLAHSLGVWLIAFYLSWSRGVRQGIISPILIRYEEDVLDGERLIKRLAGGLAMTEEQVARLRDYVANPDRERSRFNVGIEGRGRAAVPESAKSFLRSHLNLFAEEIPQAEIDYLLG